MIDRPQLTAAGLCLVIAALASVSASGLQTARGSGLSLVDNAIYVPDTLNDRIVRLSGFGKAWTAFGGGGNGVAAFRNPTAAVVDQAGRIYVADSGNARIVRIDDISGRGWTALGRLGDGVNEFAFPTGVAIDARGRIYIAGTSSTRAITGSSGSTI